MRGEEKAERKWEKRKNVGEKAGAVGNTDTIITLPCF